MRCFCNTVSRGYIEIIFNVGRGSLKIKEEECCDMIVAKMEEEVQKFG